tara:strand:- start:906 stop:1034 length:129 start_codon:yes stop_codon:yes gene_type:complete
MATLIWVEVAAEGEVKVVNAAVRIKKAKRAIAARTKLAQDLK